MVSRLSPRETAPCPEPRLRARDRRCGQWEAGLPWASRGFNRSPGRAARSLAGSEAAFGGTPAASGTRPAPSLLLFLLPPGRCPLRPVCSDVSRHGGVLPSQALCDPAPPAMPPLAPPCSKALSFPFSPYFIFCFVLYLPPPEYILYEGRDPPAPPFLTGQSHIIPHRWPVPFGSFMPSSDLSLRSSHPVQAEAEDNTHGAPCSKLASGVVRGDAGRSWSRCIRADG